MDDRFNYYATRRTDSELEERIDNRQKYLPETIEASLQELQNRGRVFSDDELRVIGEDIQARRESAETVENGIGLFSNAYKNWIVEDPDAPDLYSKRALYAFTILFSVVFGSIMMAINLFKLKNNRGAWLTLLFGAGYLTVQVLVAYKSGSKPNGDMSFIFGLGAAIIINMVLWPRFVGNTTLYKAKPIWVPLAIALVMVALIMWSAIYAPQQ